MAGEGRGRWVLRAVGPGALEVEGVFGYMGTGGKPMARTAAFLAFVVVVLVVYGAMHGGFFVRVRPLVPWRAGRVALFAFLCVMMGGPFLARALDAAGSPGAARALAWAAYTWMGFLFLANCAGLMVRLSDLGLWAASRVGFFSVPAVGPRAGAILVLCLALPAAAWGLWENTGLDTRALRFPAPLPAGVERVRVVMVSDLHLEEVTGLPELGRVLARVKDLAPDVLVMNGDLLDVRGPFLDEAARMFREIAPPLGAYAVLGNHEAYFGVRESEEFFRRCGFTLLGGRWVEPGGLFFLAGVDDPACGHPDNGAELLKAGRGRGLFTLFLRHQPDLPRETRGRFDLQLSGHTHGGQIFPLHFVVGLRFPRLAGLYPVAEGGAVYTSRGTGSWGPPLRILATREITVVDLVRR